MLPCARPIAPLSLHPYPSLSLAASSSSSSQNSDESSSSGLPDVVNPCRGKQTAHINEQYALDFRPRLYLCFRHCQLPSALPLPLARRNRHHPSHHRKHRHHGCSINSNSSSWLPLSQSLISRVSITISPVASRSRCKRAALMARPLLLSLLSSSSPLSLLPFRRSSLIGAGSGRQAAAAAGDARMFARGTAFCRQCVLS